MLTSTTWPVGTRVRLLSVPWDSSYRDVVAWESADKRDEWFESKSGAWFASNFQNLRPGEPVDVPVPYSSVYKYNYIAVTNPQQPVTDEGPERTYFYFVTSAQYLSPQATRLTIQLDVMTTYAGAIEYGRAFVERGHIAMANDNARGELTGAKLNKYLSLPEGLDIGSEYVPCAREFIPVVGPELKYGPKIIIISTADLAADPGTESSPSLNVADGQFADGLPSGSNVYWCSLANFKSVMAAMKNKSWAAQCIVSIYTFPGRLLSDGPSFKLFGSGPEMHFIGNTDSLTADSEPYWETANVFGRLQEGIGADTQVSKLYAYPYSVIELATFTGNPIYLKPQLINGSKLSLYWIGCALAPFAKVGFFPRNYGDPEGKTQEVAYTYMGFEGEVKNGVIPGGDFLDTAVWLTDFPQFSLVNNNYLTYLAGTVHTRNYSYQSAGWAKDRANMVALNDYGNALTGANAAYDVEKQRVGAGVQNLNNNFKGDLIGAGSSAINSVGGGLVSGMVTGSPIGPVAGSTHAVTGLVQNLAAAEINMTNGTNNLTAMANIADINRAAAGSVADSNLALAKGVNRGDYQNAIAGINATVQDAALTPPSTVGQAGGEGFNWKNGLVGITVTYKTLAGASKATVADYFRRYGYAVQRFLPLGSIRHMLCMSKFAYWKCKESNITCGKANETERETMRGVIEKGVTLWASPADIGKTALTDNQPLDGYSY